MSNKSNLKSYITVMYSNLSHAIVQLESCLHDANFGFGHGSHMLGQSREKLVHMILPGWLTRCKVKFSVNSFKAVWYIIKIAI